MADHNKAFSNINLAEAYGLAAKVEEEGYTFYDKVIQLTDDERTKEDLGFLRDQEKGHKHLFEKLLEKSGLDYKNDSGSPLYQWAKKDLLDPVRTALEETPPKSSQEALRIGIELETGSVRFYKTIKKAAQSKEDKTALTKIIKEEQSHKKFLNAILKYTSVSLALLSDLKK